MGKKHRQASTRPKKGRAPKVSPTTGAVAPRKRKLLAAKRTEAEKQQRLPMRSPDREARVTLTQGRQKPVANESAEEQLDWREAELRAASYDTGTKRVSPDAQSPLVAICGRPNVGKSTL